MESSPLAVMQPPPSPGTWGYRRDLASTRPRFNLGANNFNFKDLSMKKGGSDYFASKAARASSPTVSLAADLAQNFTIDQSPQLPTPRRSLFTTNIFQRAEQKGATTPDIWREGMTTPPIPSSSPGYGNDGMDISPLPHKGPCGFIARGSVQSPTPEPAENGMDLSCSPPPNPLLDSPMPPPDRKKPTFPLRPSLSRAKTHYSTPIALHAKENVVPFQFNTSHNSSETDLSSCFKASPVQDRKIHFHLHGGPRSRHANLSNMFNRCNGSPVPGVRKTAPAVRPRKQFRRSLSMFENPGDVMNAESEHVSSGLAAIMDIDETPRLSLPTLPSNGEPNSLPRIEAKTLADVLDGQYSHVFEETMVIDCRFEYEYEGGHIDGAVNHCEREALADRLFDPYTDPSSHKKTLLVFHCEYSELRAPRMAEFIRSRDRAVNEDNYPRLTYPEVYILHGGYSSFYESYKQRCFPQNYLRMESEEHERACEAGLHKLKQRAKLGRAQTFAFGEGCGMEDSPTAPSRSRSTGSALEAMHDPNLGPRVRAHRMASY
ncbi:M-phase inducer phosphatase [Lasiodiplodia hormozganensis]|uniref:M-phase inducer phosphatase n=1 Tax=Lasiodiplodia hormozganensis TaxID=869390 RepID=A0AA40D4L0_9PEZI|nr:M-phase inducer phosphatase [Lasiodiplodia hormozganensis]